MENLVVFFKIKDFENLVIKKKTTPKTTLFHILGKNVPTRKKKYQGKKIIVVPWPLGCMFVE
jgi:hypothetical protein